MKITDYRIKFMVVVLLALTAGACEKVTHANIDKWRNTEQGPGKLAGVLKDAKQDADMRAHAAQALVSIEKTDQVAELIGAMPEADRAAVMEKLTPRLWADAKFTDQEQAPTKGQLRAKDALFQLRDLAAGRPKDEVDGYLLDWLTAGGYYEQRAPTGQHHGEHVVRTLGPKSAPKLVEAARKVLDTPPDKAGQIMIFGPQLLKGLASCGSAAAVDVLLEIAEKERIQEGLQIDAIGVMYAVYVVDVAILEPKVDSKAIVPHVKRFEAIAASSSQPGENRNVIYEILAVLPRENCIPPLASLAGKGDSQPLQLRAVEYGLRCGGADAVIPLALALPDADYGEEILLKYFVKKIPEKELPKAVAPARALLSDPKASWVARHIAIEILGLAGDKTDAARVRAFAKDKTKLRGWWGDQRDTPKKDVKQAPTLGARAVEVAEILEKKQ